MDVLFELRSFNWSHQSEEGSYPLYFCLGWLLVGHARIISGIVSFLLTCIACSSHVLSVSSARCIVHLCGAWSASRRIGCQWACICALAKPSQECGHSGCHFVACTVIYLIGVHLPPSVFVFCFMHLVPCLPNILSRPGFRKEVKSDVTAKLEAPVAANRAVHIV